MPKIKVKGQAVLTGEHPQTNGRYQMYYLPCYAVDNQSTALRSIKCMVSVMPDQQLPSQPEHHRLMTGTRLYCLVTGTKDWTSSI